MSGLNLLLEHSLEGPPLLREKPCLDELAEKQRVVLLELGARGAQRVDDEVRVATVPAPTSAASPPPLLTANTATAPAATSATAIAPIPTSMAF